ncbi:CocE/NonD family hydrolase [Tsukamurella asaccharolytica]|uniref:CocE/NonD family hydrolase n=1 Tax=Tsukamurella asaccharolytica TaxID=2592067 RepID=A0A5C5RDL4_9ACTN|nr:CocE/NonD family hydrolase [Tsukamurella asaccharolytica]TWS20758.1 CocE/NonD family hydrolase [Tsukamurella asaccharolytica]
MVTSRSGRANARLSSVRLPLWDRSSALPSPSRGQHHSRVDHTLPLGDPTGGADALAWREAVDGRLTYPRVHIDRNVDIRMSDGVVLRATVVRPAELDGVPVARPYPAILNLNPYNRMVVDAIDETTHAAFVGPALTNASKALTGGTVDFSGGLLQGFGINRRLVRSGYVQVIVDVRGTGTSHGVWQILGPREQRDSVEVLAWAREQAWCDGKLGMGGWSYSAINSLQAAGHAPEGLGAVFAIEGSEDIVRDIYITGGLPSVFIPLWLGAVNALKWLYNPRTLLRDTVNGNVFRWLHSRLLSPATEVSTVVAGVLTGRDPRVNDNPYFTERNANIESITAPTFLFGGWHDLFGRSTPRVFSRLNLPAGRKQMVITNGFHFDMGAGFGGTQAPPRIDVLERAWYDRWLKGIDNGVDRYGPVTLQQQGGGWSAGESFPRAGARTRRLYATPASSGTAGHTRYDGGLAAVPERRRASASTRIDLRGLASPDLTQVLAGLTKAVPALADAGVQERGAISFTSPPAVVPVQLSGSINVHLVTQCEGEEAIWAVTVNDVAPDGTSTVLSGGALMASNRALDAARSSYDLDGELLGAFHPLTWSAKQPVVPGETIELDIDVVPTDALLEEGHRLRVDVYAGSVPRYLATVPDLLKTRFGKQTVLFSPDRPSYVSLQIVGDPGW